MSICSRPLVLWYCWNKILLTSLELRYVAPLLYFIRSWLALSYLWVNQICMQLQFKIASLRFWKIWYASPSGMYLHLNRVKRRLIFDQQPKTHPCHRGKIWEYAGYFVYITDSNCILLDQMIREALNNQVGKQKGSFWAHTGLFGCNKADSILLK